MFTQFRSGMQKLLVCGAMGAAGCAGGALIGELFLWLTSPAAPDPSKATPRAVCLLLDCSGSMGADDGSIGSKLSEVKRAAREFVKRQDLSLNSIAVVGFGSGVDLAIPLSNSAADIERAINSIHDGGGTAMELGLDAAFQTVSSSELSRNILLFTDGAPNNRSATLTAARTAEAGETRIVAVATSDADLPFLAQVTGDPDLVLLVTAGNFADGFTKAERLINGLVGSSRRRQGFITALLIVGVWTGFIAWGLAIAMVGGQNLSRKRTFLLGSEAVQTTAGGVLAGLIAGAAGQFLYSPAAYFSSFNGFKRGLLWAGVGLILGGVAAYFLPRLRSRLKNTLLTCSLILGGAGWFVLPYWVTFEPVARVLGWAVLGYFIGAGMARIVPNLDRRRAPLAGALGAAVGAVAFIAAAHELNETLGRLLGAAILGFAIGILVAYVEIAYREFWLEVTYCGTDKVQVNLGDRAVTVGSASRDCTVYVHDAPSVALCYRIERGQIYCESVPDQREQPVSVGDKRQFGTTVVEVCGKE